MPRAKGVDYLARLRAMARARGGRLLSPRYRGGETKLRFRCAAGHEWKQTPGAIQQGKWCTACAIARNAAREKTLAVAALRRLVAGRGGTIVSRVYINSQTKLRYRCREGHEWEAVPASLTQGRWCPVCAERDRAKHHEKRRSLVHRRLLGIVKQHGGEILPPGYLGYKKRIRLRCANGHVWDAPPEGIDAGVWCPRCEEDMWLDRFRARAERWGGELLSTRARSGQEKLLWRCAQAHRFRKTGQAILSGSWCDGCRGTPRGDIERMRRVARERGGECLSKRYVDAGVKLRWRCREGHRWIADPGSIIQGSWCPVCQVRQGHSLAPLSLGIMRAMAVERGGACLTRAYHGAKTRMRWRCARGHTWAALAFNVRKGHWCPVCAHTVRGTLDGMRAMAIERGGRCLTTIWNNHRLPLTFVCARGHRFTQLAGVVKTGVWCPSCRR